MATFYGMTSLDSESYVVTEFCSKGQLNDILQNDKYRLDNVFKFSIAIDVASGMEFLHSRNIIHGNLKSSSCLIDPRWNVKISYWERQHLSSVQEDIESKQLTPIDEIQKDHWARQNFWTAPECLNTSSMQTLNAAKSSDYYSFAIVLQEIFTREDPYDECTGIVSPWNIIIDVVHKSLRPVFTVDTPNDVRSILSDAWHKDPDERPNFKSLIKRLKSANPSKKGVLDCMMDTLEEYVLNLEEKIEERTEALNVAMTNMTTLLHKMLPPTVADKLSNGQQVDPEYYDSVTIFFSDIVGFTSLSASSTPIEIVNFLNDLYTCFDSIIDKHQVYKVETIGDAYMVISGLPIRNGIDHVRQIALMALEIRQSTDDFIIRHRPSDKLRLRAGVHSGPVVAGVVGLKMPRYCLFGDTVNTASRMESTSEAMKIQLSEDASDLLAQIGGFVLKPRGVLNVKVSFLLNQSP